MRQEIVSITTRWRKNKRVEGRYQAQRLPQQPGAQVLLRTGARHIRVHLSSTQNRECGRQHSAAAADNSQQRVKERTYIDHFLEVLILRARACITSRTQRARVRSAKRSVQKRGRAYARDWRTTPQNLANASPKSNPTHNHTRIHNQQKAGLR